MHRQAFEEHAIWAQIESAIERVKEVQDTQPPAEEVPSLLRIEFILKHVASYRSLAATSSALFNDQLLGPVQSIVAQLVSYLQQRQASYNYRSYTDNALGSAESLLVQIGNWPRPYAKGAQIQQINTLYEGLLEMQEQQIAEFEARYDATRDKLGQLVTDFDAKKAQVEGQFELYRTEALAVSSSVDHEKSRIDDVVQKGLEKVAELQARNTDAFAEWKQQVSDELEEYTDGQKDAIDRALTSAAGALKRLKENEKEYANISAAAGGAKLAAEFNAEATDGQKLGLQLYTIGFGVLILAALPLVLWLFWPPAIQEGDGIWQHFLIRISLGVLGASAATVLIRLGSRFVTSATASKRMALELQTFGPFLANVTDKETVDSARLELVDRAFGKSYAPGESDSKDDAVPVSAFAHILDLVKAIK
ncbi:hypothetical protein JHV56_16430 [Arthrobacter sp. BHU FT2]|nr:hypothetical protein [Arthrobacter sp. BHU FT2]